MSAVESTTNDQATPSGDWLLTAEGKQFYPLDPRPEAVSLDDIARALSHLCRWTGHTRYHYSVAQHAVQVALAVEHIAPDWALAALHHDDAEAYLGDIARPWKKHLWVYDGRLSDRGTHIELVELRVRSVIFQALGIDTPEAAWPVIQAADDRVLQAEYNALLPKHLDFPYFGGVPAGCSVEQMPPHAACAAFLYHHQRLSALVRQA